MKFFRVRMDSASMCGFESFGYFQAESEDDLYQLDTFEMFAEEMQDYVDGWVSEEDYEYNEEANLVIVNVEEISKKEYDEMMKLYDVERPFYTG